MTDAAVGFLLHNLGRLWRENVELIGNVKTEVQGLENDLKMLKAFLEDAVEESRELQVVKQLMTQIRELTFEMEDAIDTYVYEAATFNAKSPSKQVFSSGAHAFSLRHVAEKAQMVMATVEKVRYDPSYNVALQRSNHRGKNPVERKPPVVEEDNSVGFDEITTDIIDRLTDKTDPELQVISIIAMPGLGKTTLANKVYEDPRVTDAFPTQAWIYVSRTYTKKDLLLSILESGNQVTNATDEKSLVQEVRAYLTWKYLIVLDDVWEPEHWDDIKDAFPNCRNGSRILLTSRIHDVGVHANRFKKPYRLDFLSDDQSWELLQIKAFGQRECPPDRQDLIPLGKKIAKHCCGLPLALALIGGLLQTKSRKDQWEIVSQSVGTHLGTYRGQLLKKLLDLCYDQLPPHLKACLLYFGVFPIGYEIPVWILIRLWIAEGLVQKVDNVSLEKVVEDYLDELAARNLVLVERSFSGRIKKCHVDNILRDLFLQKALEECFLFEIKANGETTTVRPDRHRRLCIHSGVLEYISSRPRGSHVRSFLCFAKDQVRLPEELAPNIPEEFKLLRTYHIQCITFPRFPSEIQNLIHLTYVAFSGDFTSIPAAISKLWNLQTLIAHTTSRAKPNISIEADILKMSEFRHLHTNKPSQLIDTIAKKSKELDKASSKKSIQTLNTITPESCTLDNLGQTRDIRKLGICGKLSALVDGKRSLFDNLTDLKLLVTLKLFNDVQPDPPSKHKLQRLPQWDKFPPNLERLTLKDTFLDWAQMYVLGMLPNLEELKLKENAFTGERWDTVNGGFKKLRALQVWKTNLEFWEAEEEHFPRLEYLFLKNCMNLVEVPSSLGNMETLRTIKLHRTSPSSAASARRIKKRQQESKGLKIEIFPPDLGQASSPDDY